MSYSCSLRHMEDAQSTTTCRISIVGGKGLCLNFKVSLLAEETSEWVFTKHSSLTGVLPKLLKKCMYLQS